MDLFKYQETNSEYDDFFSSKGGKTVDRRRAIYLVEDWMEDSTDVIETNVDIVDFKVIEQLEKSEVFPIELDRNIGAVHYDRSDIFFSLDAAADKVASNVLARMRKGR